MFSFWLCLIRTGANIEAAAIPATAVSMCNASMRVLTNPANTSRPDATSLLELGRSCPEGMTMVVNYIAPGWNDATKPPDSELSVQSRVADWLARFDKVINALPLADREAAWCPVAPIIAPTLAPPTEIPGEAYTMDDLRRDLEENSRRLTKPIVDEATERAATALTDDEEATVIKARTLARLSRESGSGNRSGYWIKHNAETIEALCTIIGRLSCL